MINQWNNINKAVLDADTMVSATMKPAVSRRRRPVLVIDLHYTGVDRKASSSRSPGRLLFAERTHKRATVIGFSSGVLNSLSSMEMRLLLRDCGRADPSLLLQSWEFVQRQNKQTDHLKDDRSLTPGVYVLLSDISLCLTVNPKELRNF